MEVSSLHEVYPKRECTPYLLLNPVLYIFRCVCLFHSASPEYPLRVFTIISFMSQVDYKALNRPAGTNLNQSVTNAKESINWLLKSVTSPFVQYVVHADGRL